LPYSIDFRPEGREHFRSLTAHQRALVTDAMERQLRYQPAVPSRNRKRLRPNRIAEWELRVRDLRVYYTVSEEEALITIRAIGIKIRDQVYAAGRRLDFL
jgi:mRNA-degrading endonuclease RelE of RelBE toxin-antitoxin system